MEKTDNTENITKQPEKIFIDIDPENPVSEIESLCMNCHKNGVTRLLLTKIPFFKDIIIMAFDCPHCHFRNNEVQSASDIADYGIKFVLKIVNRRDLDRKIVKTEHAEIKVSYCGLEIPKETQKSKLSTVEGFLTCARDDMQNAIDEGVYDGLDDNIMVKIKDTVKKITDIVEGKVLPVEFTLEDPSGNSFIENPYSPNRDVYCTVTHFVRTKEMAEEMGYSLHNQSEESKNIIGKKNHNSTYEVSKPLFEVYKSKSHISAHLMDLTKSVEENTGDTDTICIPEICSVCKQMGEQRVCVISIPYFKELIITCFSCNFCYFKSSEVKGGGGISDKGKKITLEVKCIDDLSRDLFKSETSQIIIPELEFESSEGSLGSMFTTVEGLLDKICMNIRDTPFTHGDSQDDKGKFDKFISDLECLKSTEVNIFKPFTLILDDPGSNSFLFSVNHEDPEKDTQMKIVEYTRSYDQDEDLGLNQMKTEDYEQDHELTQKKKINVIKEENENENENEEDENVQKDEKEVGEYDNTN